MKKITAILLAAFMACAATFGGEQPKTESMKIKITIDGASVTATLNDTPISRDFLSMLPIELNFEDYANSEKIAYPNRKLSTKDAPDGHKASAGDINYYAPWGNLAVFYKSIGFSRGLVNIGKIDGDGIKLFSGKKGKFSALIEKDWK